MLHKILGLFMAFLPVWMNGQSPFTLPQDVVVAGSPKGTGNASGIIATITLRNNSSETIHFTTLPLFIPSAGKYQAYLVPASSRILLPPGQKTEVSLHGYCLDLHKPAVPAGKKLPSPEEWIAIDHTLDNSINKYLVDPKYLTLPRIVANLPGEINAEGKTALIPRERLEEGLLMVLDAYEKLETTLISLRNNHQIVTVFSAFPEKEKQTLLQHTIWLYTAALTGSTYEYEYFEKKLILELENETSTPFHKMSGSLQREIIEEGKVFWKTFLDISNAAGVIRPSARE